MLLIDIKQYNKKVLAEISEMRFMRFIDLKVFKSIYYMNTSFIHRLIYINFYLQIWDLGSCKGTSSPSSRTLARTALWNFHSMGKSLTSSAIAMSKICMKKATQHSTFPTGLTDFRLKSATLTITWRIFSGTFSMTTLK